MELDVFFSLERNFSSSVYPRQNYTIMPANLNDDEFDGYKLRVSDETRHTASYQ